MSRGALRRLIPVLLGVAPMAGPTTSTEIPGAVLAGVRLARDWRLYAKGQV